MKLLKTITVLALTAGLFVSCTKNEHEGGKLIGDTHQAVLTAAPASQKIAKDGTAGKVLDVEVQPEDATWDWADVEIASNSETFNFYPSTHTIAINKLAAGADAHVLGVQVKFWLKSNHNIYDYVYIDMNQSSQ